MDTKLPVSVHVLTMNSAATLDACLASVRECAEIIVVDGGSTDDTLAIAKRYNAKVIAQPAAALSDGRIVDFAAVRNAALDTTKQLWVLALDSDEEASPALMGDIRHVMESDAPADAYRVPRRYRLPNGEIVRYATTYPNERVYFFRREAAETWIKPVHERIRLRPGSPVGRFSGAMLAPLGTVEDYKRKNRVYLALEAARGGGWGVWLGRVLRVLRSRAIATLKLAWIWLVPHAGRRLPFAHERARYWYAWRTLVETCPLNARHS